MSEYTKVKGSVDAEPGCFTLIVLIIVMTLILRALWSIDESIQTLNRSVNHKEVQDGK